jgi:hypothetical protein
VLGKMKKINKLFLIMPLVVIFIAGVYFVKSELNKNVYKDNTKVLSTITQVLSVNTVKYNYSNVITVKKDKSINDLTIPFTEKSFIVKYNGVINGGINPDDINVIKNTGKEIELEITNCQILDHYIDTENIYVYDIKNSLFNKLEVQEVLEDINEYKKEYEQKAISEGLLDGIKETTKISIENMFKGLGYKEVIVNYN